MPVALKAQWCVKAGILLGEVVPEWQGVWSYTSVDFEKDGNEYGPLWRSLNRAADKFANQLRLTANWVTIEYMWL